MVKPFEYSKVGLLKRLDLVGLNVTGNHLAHLGQDAQTCTQANRLHANLFVPDFVKNSVQGA